MGDLSKRPRGGWQVGTRILGRKGGGLYTDEHPDPAPDCFTVERQAVGFLVKHFPTSEAARPCCVFKVTPRTGEDEVATLARADRMCAVRHSQLPNGAPVAVRV